MTIAIVIGMHGSAAQQLLKTAEMLLGEQKNIAWIDFLPGENTESLIKKYTALLDTLETDQGVLFLVDTWGGSPFNAASRLVQNKENYDVITGVNIPMLTETLMARDDEGPFTHLVALALESGREGVRALQQQLKKNDNTAVAHTPAPPPSAPGGHMKIALARIDDRLIHGQVVTRWTKESHISRIIVVNDAIAADENRKVLLKQAAPPGVTAHIVSVNKMVRVWNNPAYNRDRVILLFNNPYDVLRLVEQDVDIPSVNIGGMAFQQGKMQINNAVSVDENDIDAFRQLNARGIALEVRKVPSDPRLNMMELLKKHHP